MPRQWKQQTLEERKVKNAEREAKSVANQRLYYIRRQLRKAGIAEADIEELINARVRLQAAEEEMKRRGIWTEANEEQAESRFNRK